MIANVSSTLLYSVGLPVAVAVLTAACTLVLNHLGAAADRRRDRYAQAVQTLVAWVEFPYRVRRRTDDAPATLASLADVGHDIQERLACHEAWIATEKPAVARKYASVRVALGEAVGPAVAEAWSLPPVTAPEQMILGNWGPAAASKPLIASLQLQIEHRFGLRRLRKPQDVRA
ncbi:MAG: hypothetical protein ABSB09_07915 [Acidimicrobiales bacterium]|jgi:hypothetical protein